MGRKIDSKIGQVCEVGIYGVRIDQVSIVKVQTVMDVTEKLRPSMKVAGTKV